MAHVGHQQHHQRSATPASLETAAIAAQAPWSAGRLWDPNPLIAPAQPQQQQVQPSRPSRMQGEQQGMSACMDSCVASDTMFLAWISCVAHDTMFLESLSSMPERMHMLQHLPWQ